MKGIDAGLEHSDVRINCGDRLMKAIRDLRPDIMVDDIVDIAGLGLDTLCQEGLSAERYAALLSYLDDQWESDCFPLAVGSAADIAEFGIFGYSMLSSLDAESMAKVGVNYQLLNGYGFSVKVRQREGQVAMLIGDNPGLDEKLNLSLLLEFVGATISILEKLFTTHSERPVLAISLLAPQPVCARWLETQLLIPVLYGQAENILFFNPQVISSFSNPLSADVNALFLQRCEEQLDAIRQNKEPAIVNQVKELIFQLLQTQVPTQALVAKQLCVSTRTMNRRLKSYDTSFSQLLLDCRMTLAESMLSTQNLPIDEIAYRLGYHQPNSFFRAFKRYFGTTPRSLARVRSQ